MKESDFVSYHLALKMFNDERFRGGCNGAYIEINGGEMILFIKPRESRYLITKSLSKPGEIPAPSKIQAKRWFEKHNIELDDELK